MLHTQQVPPKCYINYILLSEFHVIGQVHLHSVRPLLAPSLIDNSRMSSAHYPLAPR